MKLTRLDAKRWRAEIDYRSKEGKKEHKTYQGTREEIRKDIQADKDRMNALAAKAQAGFRFYAIARLHSNYALRRVRARILGINRDRLV